MGRLNNGLAPLGIIVWTCFIQCWAVQLTDVIRTHSGPVQGEIFKTAFESKECSAFRGIPFAAPPIGALRFKPPLEPQPWQSVRISVDEGSMCMQDGSDPRFADGNEDCLYINVYTPHTKSIGTQRKPVMVWIYGGAFSSGYSNASTYGPDFFLEDDVVFVSFNYRVGAFGFLSADHPDALGNSGLKDQRLALEWVQKNIANFGGDPNKVTIYGESAGGASVEYHILSEVSRGLFHQSISMSGSPLCPWSHENPKIAVEQAFNLAKELGHEAADKDDLLRFLLTAPANDIILATKAMQKAPLNLVFKPTTENAATGKPGDHFLTECPLEKFHYGKYTKVPRMLGFTKDEALMFSSSLESLVGIVNYTRRILAEIIESIVSPSGILAEWYKILPEAAVTKVIKIASSVLFNGPIDLTQRLVSGSNDGKPVYYYRVSYDSEFAMHRFVGVDRNGTAHADDIGYLFNVAFLKTPESVDHPFNQFRKRFVRLWTNFAKFGNPTPHPSGENAQLGNLLWQDSSRAGFQLDIDENFVLKPRMVDRVTEIYEFLWFLANPIIIGCKAALQSVTGGL